MYKIISIILFGLVICDAGATTMCAQDDKVVIGLGYATTPTSYEADNENSEWRVHYDGIGTISGISSCVPFGKDCEGKSGWIAELGGLFWAGCPYAAGGNDAKSNYQGRRDGNYCWCKITRPFESEWVYLYIYNADCATNCASECAVRGITDNFYSFRPAIIATTAMEDEYTVPAN